MDKRVPELADGIEVIEKESGIPNAADTVDVEAALERPEDPAAVARRDAAEREFLQHYIFRGLHDLKPAFDSPVIAHFNAADFLRVIARCNLLGVHIHGVEVFGPRAEFLEVETGEGGSNDWCVALVHRYQHHANLSFSATYSMPDSVLNESPRSLEYLDQV